MSTLRVDNYSDRLGSASIGAQTLLQGTAKAWANFNGTGVIASRDGFNIASLTDNGTGDYTINYTTAQPNTNYQIGGCAGSLGAVSGFSCPVNTAPTTSALRMITFNTTTNGATDREYVCPSIMGDPT